MLVRFTSLANTIHDSEIPTLTDVNDLPYVIVHGERAYFHKGFDTLRGVTDVPVYQECAVEFIDERRP